MPQPKSTAPPEALKVKLLTVLLRRRVAVACHTLRRTRAAVADYQLVVLVTRQRRGRRSWVNLGYSAMP